jgi:hypothetical protein
MPRIRSQRKVQRQPLESGTKVSIRVLIPTRIEFLKRQESRKAVQCARSMGACTHTILVSAINMRKTEL